MVENRYPPKTIENLVGKRHEVLVQKAYVTIMESSRVNRNRCLLRTAARRNCL